MSQEKNQKKEEEEEEEETSSSSISEEEEVSYEEKKKDEDKGGVVVAAAAAGAIKKEQFISLGLLSAKDLEKGDYAVTVSLNEEEYTTKLTKKTTAPSWFEGVIFKFDSPLGSTTVTFILIDKSKSGSDAEKMGKIQFNLSELGDVKIGDSKTFEKYFKEDGKGGGFKFSASLHSSVPDPKSRDFKQLHGGKVAFKSSSGGFSVGIKKGGMAVRISAGGGGGGGGGGSAISPSSAARSWLVISIIKAEGLTPLKADKPLDSYVKLTVGKTTKKTKVVPKNLNPIWNESFMFIAPQNYNELSPEFTVFSSQRIGSHKKLGSLIIKMQELNLKLDEVKSVTETLKGGESKECKLTFAISVHDKKPSMEAGHLDIKKEASEQQSKLTSYLIFHIVAANGLHVNDKDNANAFVKVKYGNESQKTSVISKSLEPKWDEYLSFALGGGEGASWQNDEAKIVVLDKGKKENIKLGHVSFPLSRISELKIEESKSFQLELEGEGVKGNITFGVKISYSKDHKKGDNVEIEESVKAAGPGISIKGGLKIRGPKIKKPDVDVDVDADVDVDVEGKEKKVKKEKVRK